MILREYGIDNLKQGDKIAFIGGEWTIKDIVGSRVFIDVLDYSSRRMLAFVLDKAEISEYYSQYEMIFPADPSKSATSYQETKAKNKRIDLFISGLFSYLILFPTIENTVVWFIALSFK